MVSQRVFSLLKLPGPEDLIKQGMPEFVLSPLELLPAGSQDHHHELGQVSCLIGTQSLSSSYSAYC